MFSKRKIIDHLGGFCLLHRTTFLPLPHENLVAFVEDKYIVVVETLPSWLHFVDQCRSTTSMLEYTKKHEFILGLSFFNVSETGLYTTRKYLQSWEKAHEFNRGL